MPVHCTSQKYHVVRNGEDMGQGHAVELIPQGRRSDSALEFADNNSYDTTGTSKDDDISYSHTYVKDDVHGPSKQRFRSAWRAGALVSLSGAVSVFLLNLILTIWVAKNPGYDVAGGIGTLMQGSCARVRRTNVWVHLLVNVLSTLLLCGSNYCMQVVSAPSRAELDQAHAQRHWLHIGVPSLRNLRRIAGDRSWLWLLLMLSSLPLHLLFNSVVFTNLQANNYAVIPTMEDWLYGAAYNTTGLVDYEGYELNRLLTSVDDYRINVTETISLADGSIVPRYRNVSTADCFNTYDTQYAQDEGNVYIVQSEPTVQRNQALAINASGGRIWYNRTAQDPPSGYRRVYPSTDFPIRSDPTVVPSNGWRCPSHRVSECDVDSEREVPRDRSKWAPYESPVRYCLVEQVPQLCRLQFSFLIAGIVVGCNLVKAVCMALLLFGHKKHDALVTLGDAVASFLERPDPNTRGRCLQSKTQIEMHFRGPNTVLPAHIAKKERDFEEYKPHRHRWASAPSYGTWFATYMFYFGTCVFGILAIVWALTQPGIPTYPSELWKLGFGTVNGQNLMSVKTSLMGVILLANSPQAVLSYLYLSFNMLYTNMFVGREWASYSSKRKPLRVSSPVAQQRNTYWLSVPFRFAIPMTVLSGAFHWLTSQSLFMVQISITSIKGTRRTVSEEDTILTTGFSPVAIIMTTVIATVIAIGGIVVGRLRYPAGIPVAGSNSAAISAACHPHEEDVDAQLKPVQWGVVPGELEEREDGSVVGHCSFSSLPVERPVARRRYA